VSELSIELNAPKLEQILHFKMKIETKTGLLISTGRTIGRIGGIDAENVSIKKEYICNDNKKVLVKVPYIPGSSLKGRMRSLLELSLNLPLYSTDKKIWAHTPSKDVYKTFVSDDKLGIEEFLKVIDQHKLNKLFGYSSFGINEIGELIKNEQQGTNNQNQGPPSTNQPNQNQPSPTQSKENQQSTAQPNPGQSSSAPPPQNPQNKSDYISILQRLTPTLLLVDDFFVETKYVCNIYQRNGTVSFDDFVEEKNENRIDRITAMADPRTILRVKPDVRFEGKISLLIFENMFKNVNIKSKQDIKEELKKYLELILKGLSLVEATYIGASGSRGYGRVKFVDIQVSLTKILDGMVKEEEIDGGKEFKDLNGLKNSLDVIIEEIIKYLNIQPNKGT